MPAPSSRADATPDPTAFPRGAVVPLHLEPAAVAVAAGLTYSDDSTPGFSRHRWGRGFTYRDAEGETIRDRALRRRFESLAIPPAWEAVWICTDDTGHLQATGRDARQRKQYRYHPTWRTVRDRTKFDRMSAFVRALPQVRERVSRDLARPRVDKPRVLAAAVRLLDQALLRVGNEQYTRANRSFGLTTLRQRHLELGRSTLSFHYCGKSGQTQRIQLTDRRLARILRRCHELPGQRLFQYLDETDQVHSIDSGDVNAYLREASGGLAISAKDFRTWGGTCLACTLFATTPVGPEGPPKGRLTEVVKEVAATLGNRPATARKYYIHPDVITAWESGEMETLLSAAAARGTPLEGEALGLEPDEALTLTVLEGHTLSFARPA